MIARTCVLATICVFFAAPCMGVADEKKASPDNSEAVVQLKLNTIESSQLLQRYQMLLQRKMDLDDTLQLSLRPLDDANLTEVRVTIDKFERRLQETKSKLRDLEVEKKNLLARIGNANAREVAAEATEKANATMEQVLERLKSIENRLEKIERQK